MTRIILITNDRTKTEFTRDLASSHCVRVLPSRGYQAAIELEDEQSFFYFDYSSFSSRQQTLLLQYLATQEEFEYGIIDPDDQIDDPAMLFHDGASDYIGYKLSRRSPCPQRLEKALHFYQDPEDTREDGAHNCSSDLQAPGWAEIKNGKEYPFVFLHAELDILPQWQSKNGHGFIDGLLEKFYAHIGRVYAVHDGRIWIRSNNSALLLFPQNPANQGIIVESVRLILNKVLISTELYAHNALLSYRLSLHKGVTRYMPAGNTGEVISSSLNYIFHLGQRFTPPGGLVISADAQDLIPEGLKDLFKLSGDFQGKKVLTLDQKRFNRKGKKSSG